MKKNLTEMVFILDRSGSMHGLEADTIGGFNSMIDKQKQVEGEALVSTVLFSNESTVIYDRVDIQKIEPMTDRQYTVHGCTALIDAIGGAIHHIRNVHKYIREEDRPEHTLFVITTDGYENSSHEFTRAKIKEMIEHQQSKYSWQFLFLGAGIDAYEEAASIGINNMCAMSVTATSYGTKNMYTSVTNASKTIRSSCCTDALHDESWKVGDVGNGGDT